MTVTITEVKAPIPMDQPLATETMDAAIKQCLPSVSSWSYSYQRNILTIWADAADTTDIAKLATLGIVEVSEE